MQDERVVDGDEARDRREILDRIVAELRIEARIDHEGRFRADEQRVAVGRRLRDVFGGDLIVGAGPVLDDHLLAPRLGEALRQDTAERVGHAAGRRRNDDGDDTRWIGPLAGRRAEPEPAKRHQREAMSWVCFLPELRLARIPNTLFQPPKTMRARTLRHRPSNAATTASSSAPGTTG